MAISGPVYAYFSPGFERIRRRIDDGSIQVNMKAKYVDASVVDLTSLTVTVDIVDARGTVVVNDHSCSLTGASTGDFRFTLASAQFDKIHAGGGDYFIRPKFVNGGSAFAVNDPVIEFIPQ